MLTTIRYRPSPSAFAVAALALAPAFATAGPKAYVGNFKDNTVSVIDTATSAVVATVLVAPGPSGMSVTNDGRWAYVASAGASTLSVIDTTTDRVAKTLEVGNGAHGVALSPNQHLLLVAVSGKDGIAFIDTAKQTVIATVDVPKPHSIAISPDGKFAYVASQDPNRFALVVIDLASRAIVRSVALAASPRDLEFAYGGKALYFTEADVDAVQVLDPASDNIAAEIQTGASPHYAASFRDTPLGMAVVQGPGELLLFDTRTNKAVRKIDVGKQPNWLSISRDSRQPM